MSPVFELVRCITFFSLAIPGRFWFCNLFHNIASFLSIVYFMTLLSFVLNAMPLSPFPRYFSNLVFNVCSTFVTICCVFCGSGILSPNCSCSSVIHCCRIV